MKISKKIMALLGIVIVSNLPIVSFANTIDTYNAPSKIINNKYINEIEDIISSGDYKSIKKIELDSSGNPISSKLINKKQAKSSLKHGIYTIDRGDGWVLGKDKGFIQSMVVPAEVKGRLLKTKEVEFTHSINVQGSASFGTDFIKMTIKAGYGYSFTDSKNEIIDKSITAPDNKNLFVKVQEVYRKIEVIRVKNGNIVDSASTYKPTGHTFKSIEFNNDEKVNQSKLYESSDRCILGEPGYDIIGVRDDSVYYHPKIVNTHGDGYYTLSTVKQGTSLGAYFTVPSNGTYEIRDMLYRLNIVYRNNGVGSGMSVYKVDKNDEKRVEFIKNTPTNFKAIPYESNNFVGDPLIVDLKAGEKYLIVFNEDKHYFWNTSNTNSDNVATYRMNFKKLR